MHIKMFNVKLMAAYNVTMENGGRN